MILPTKGEMRVTPASAHATACNSHFPLPNTFWREMRGRVCVCEREEVVRRGTERAMWKERRERLMKMIYNAK